MGKTKGQDGTRSLPGRQELMEQFRRQTKTRRPMRTQCPPHSRRQQGRQGPAKQLRGRHSWLTTTRARAAAAPLLSARYLGCRQASAEFVPTQLKASNCSLSKTRKKKTKIRKRTQKGESLCLRKDQAASKAKTTQKEGASCLLEEIVIVPTIASCPSFSWLQGLRETVTI